ncbi:Transcriptional adapter ada2 [Rhodosporidiobolus nylandii]
MESGVKATCDSCSADITHTVHVRCAERVGGEDGTEGRLTCPDFDLCVDCFLHGKSLGPHRPTHAYRIISSHSFPIFTRDWAAAEELALIEGAQIYGLGNWADIAEHAGGRTKEDCAEHYRRIYLESEEYPLPVRSLLHSLHSLACSHDLHRTSTPSPPPTSTPSRKAARLHELQSRPLPMPPPKPMASAPTCHELGGYMPGRLEFEHEWENEAEMLIKDMEFGRVYHFGGETQPAAPPATPAEGAASAEEEKPLPDGQNEGDEPEEELELKMAVLEMFNERYDKRMAAKEMIFDRGLINYKTMSAAERKRSKEERDLITRTKVFSRIQTAVDHEEFVDGLLYEVALRKRIAKLQSYRRAGITTLAEAERYEQAKQQRLSSKAAYRDTLALSFGASSGPRRPNPAAQITANLRNRPPPPLTLATAGSLQLLTPLEQRLCATLRILPRSYLFLKEVLLREPAAWARGRRGGRLLREKNGELLGPEEGAQGEWGEKIERVWESVRDLSGLRESEGESEEDGEGDEEMKDAAGAAAGTPMQLEA